MITRIESRQLRHVMDRLGVNRGGFIGWSGFRGQRRGCRLFGCWGLHGRRRAIRRLIGIVPAKSAFNQRLALPSIKRKPYRSANRSSSLSWGSAMVTIVAGRDETEKRKNGVSNGCRKSEEAKVTRKAEKGAYIHTGRGSSRREQHSWQMQLLRSTSLAVWEICSELA